MAMYGFRCRECGRGYEVEAPMQEGPGAPPFCCNEYTRRDFGSTMITANPVAFREGNRVSDAERAGMAEDRAEYNRKWAEADSYKPSRPTTPVTSIYDAYEKAGAIVRNGGDIGSI